MQMRFSIARVRLALLSVAIATVLVIISPIVVRAIDPFSITGASSLATPTCPFGGSCGGLGTTSVHVQSSIPEAQSRAQRAIDKTLRSSAAVAFKRMVYNLVISSAQWLANKITGGGPNGSALFYTDDYGTFIKNILSTELNSTLQQLTGGIGIYQNYPQQLQQSLAQGILNQLTPPDALRARLLAEQPQFQGGPLLNMSQFINTSDLTRSLGFLTNVDERRSQRLQAETLQRQEGQGFKPVTNNTVSQGTTADIGTPAQTTKRLAENLADTSQLTKAQTTYTGDIIADAVDVFVNTLVYNLFQKLLAGLFKPKANQPATAVAPGQSPPPLEAPAAEITLSTEVNPRFAVGGPFEILSDLASCPQPDKPGPTECVIDEGLRFAIENQLSVRQAAEQGHLKLDAPFGFRADGFEPSYKEGYPYRSLIILRKYRILPVGWELAAQYAKEMEHRSYTLRQMIDASADPTSPYYQLLDSSWVLKAPELFCRRKGPGPQIVSETITDGIDVNGNGNYNDKGDTPPKRVVVRNENYCADEQSCLEENPDGSCRFYGYCTGEQRQWNIQGSKCEETFNTCTTVERTGDDSGTQLSLLLNTVNAGYCSQDSVGCQQLSLPQRNADGTLKTDAKGNPSFSAETKDQLYLNGRAQACDQDAQGCTAYLSLGQTIDNLTPEEVVSRVTRADPATTDVTNYNPYRVYAPNLKVAYLNENAPRCTRADVGCDEWTAKGSSTSVTAIAGAQDECPASCVGFGLYEEEATHTAPARDVRIIPDTAKSCNLQDVGCEEYTNLDEVARGGEGKEYYTFVRQCIKPGDAPHATFYTYGGSDQSSYQLQTFDLKLESGTSSTPQLTTGAYATGNCQAQFPADPTCVELLWVPPSADITTLTANQIEKRYVRLSDVIYADDNCHPLRPTRLITFSQCLQTNGTWNGAPTCTPPAIVAPTACQFIGGVSYDVGKCRLPSTVSKDSCVSIQGTWDPNPEGYCEFKGIPSQSASCRPQASGCRFYQGTISQNSRDVVNESFDQLNGATPPVPVVLASDCESSASTTGIDADRCWRFKKRDDGASTLQDYTPQYRFDAFRSQSGKLDDYVAYNEWGINPDQTIYHGVLQRYIPDLKPGVNYYVYLRQEQYDRNYDGSFAVHLLGQTQSIKNIPVDTWGQYRLGPFRIDTGQDLGSAGERWSNDNYILSLEGTVNEGREAYDDVRVLEAPDTATLIENSWTTPTECIAPMLGCRLWRSSTTNKTRTLKSWSAQCAPEVVGCQAYVDTRNTMSPFASPSYSVRLQSTPSTYQIPQDAITYRVDQREFECRAADRGCSLLGRGGKPTYLINDPDQYEGNGKMLCSDVEVGCSSFNVNIASADDQNAQPTQMYFKDPTIEKNKLCEFKLMPGQEKPGWYIKRESTDKTLVTTPDCPTTRDLTIGESGTGVEQPSQGYVGLCPQQMNGCTEYVDPVSTASRNLLFNPDLSQKIKNPSQPDGWNLFGGTLTINGSQQVAVGRYEQSIELEPWRLYRLAVRASAASSSGGVLVGVIDPNGQTIIRSPDESMREIGGHYGDAVISDGSLAAFNAVDAGAFARLDANEHRTVSGRFMVTRPGVYTIVVYPGVASIDMVELKRAGVYYVKDKTTTDGDCNGVIDEDKGCVLMSKRSIESVAAQTNLIDESELNENAVGADRYWQPVEGVATTVVDAQGGKGVRGEVTHAILLQAGQEYVMSAVGQGHALALQLQCTLSVSATGGLVSTDGSFRALSTNAPLPSNALTAQIFRSFESGPTTLEGRIRATTALSCDLHVSTNASDTQAWITNVVVRRSAATLAGRIAKNEFDADQLPQGHVPQRCLTGSPHCLANANGSVLKATPDRQCREWLACKTALSSKDEQGATENLCFEVGRCTALDDSGNCINFPVETPAALNFSAHGAASTLTADRVRDFTGYVKVGLADSAGNPVIPGYYPFSQMTQVGGNANVPNGDMEDVAERGKPKSWDPPASVTPLWDPGQFVTLSNPKEIQDAGIRPGNGHSVLKVIGSNIAESAPIDVFGNTDYVLAAKMNTIPLKAGYYGIVNIEELGQDSQTINVLCSDTNPASQRNCNRLRLQAGLDWTQLTWKFHTNSSTRFVRIRLLAERSQNNIRCANDEMQSSNPSDPASACTPTQIEGSFVIDDVELAPVLQVRPNPASPTSIQAQSATVTRECRLFPRSDSLQCSYRDQQGIRYKGLQGYCLEHDPRDPNACLVWWPVEVIAGDARGEIETFYHDRAPLYYCAESMIVKTKADRYMAQANTKHPDRHICPSGYRNEVVCVSDCDCDEGENCGLFSLVGPAPRYQMWCSPIGTPVFQGADPLGRFPSDKVFRWYPDDGTLSTVASAFGDPPLPGGKEILVSMCKQLVQVALADGTNKAWLDRIQGGYTVPQLNYTYAYDLAPYGGVVVPQDGDPDSPPTWSLKAPLVSRPPSSNAARMGSPYACSNTETFTVGGTTFPICQSGDLRVYTNPSDNNGLAYPGPGGEQCSQAKERLKHLFLQSYRSFEWTTAGSCVDFPRPRGVCRSDDPSSPVNGLSCTNSISGCRFGANRCKPNVCRDGLSVSDCGLGITLDANGVCNGGDYDGYPVTTNPSDCQALSGGRCLNGPDGGKECQGSASNCFSGSGTCVSLDTTASGTCGSSNKCVGGSQAGHSCTTNSDCWALPLDAGKYCVGGFKDVNGLATSTCNQVEDCQRPGSTFNDQGYIPNTPGNQCEWSVPSNRCPNNVRPQPPGDDFCVVGPRIPSIVINGQSRDMVVVHPTEFATLKFTSEIDPNQLPLKGYQIDWGDGETTSLSGVEIRNRPNPANPHMLHHLYNYWDILRAQQSCRFKDSAGNCRNDVCTIGSVGEGKCTLTVRIQIQDNWGWCNGCEETLADGNQYIGCNTQQCISDPRAWETFDGHIEVREK